MNDIFNDNVSLKTETPAFAKHVLPAVPSSEVYLEESCEKFDYSIHQQKNSQTRLPEIKIISNTKENETI